MALAPTTVIKIHAAPIGWQHNRDAFEYVGRAGHGLNGYYGNPLRALTGYDAWLVERLRTDLKFRNGVRGLAGKTLICFCKPKPCHGDSLAMWADLLAAGIADQWLDMP